MAVQIQLRGGTLAEWTSANPIIAIREMVLETDTDKFKIGNGVDNYLDLPYGGLVGPQGIQGEQGIQGVQGEQGENGPQGVSITLKGSVATSSALPSTGNTVNDAYIVDADGDLWVWALSGWYSVGQIVGPQGLKGDTGAQGPQGEQGLKGDKGDKGDQGIQGIKGDKGDTGDTGATGAAGPQGIQGIKGDKGDKGDTGATGPQGATGDSSTHYHYNARTNTTSGDPTANQLGWNNSTQINSTALRVNHIDADGQDDSIFLDLISQYDVLIIQDKNDSANYQKWEVSGTPTYNSTWDNFPVTLIDSGGTGTTNFSGGHSLILVIISVGNVGPQGPTGPTGATGPTGPAGPGVAAGGTAGQILSKIDGTDYNTQWTNIIDGGTA